MLSEPLIYTITGIVVLCILGIVLRRDPYKGSEADELGISERDMSNYAGMVVAYDCDTNEVHGVANTVELIKWMLENTHPERMCHLVRLPSERGGPIQLLGHFGPCETHSESEDR
jgi:hypothetical protein